MFQFHKVRLKETGRDIGWSDVELFQFHKVRLKESDQKKFIGNAVFQFHKVRLKDYLQLIPNNLIKVSIP